MSGHAEGGDGGETKGEAAVPAMSSQGESGSHKKCKNESIGRFDTFVKEVPASEAHGTAFAELPASVLAERKVWEQFTAHLGNMKITGNKNNGEYYAINTILNTMGNVMNNAKDRFGSAQEHCMFFKVRRRRARV